MQFVYWILAIALSLAAGYWVYRADRRRAVPYPWLTATLRALVIFLTALLLLAPSFTATKNETEKPIVLFLQDNSASIPAALKADSAAYHEDANRLLTMLAEDYRVVKWGFGERVQRDTLFQYTHEATDIAAALSQAATFYGQQNLGAVILASDGRYNQGANPQFLDLSLPGAVYTVALGDSALPRDIRIANVYANRTVSLNSQFEIRADIVATRSSGYSNSVRLTELNGSAAGSAQLSIPTDRFDRAVSFTVRADRPGLHHYVISVPPAEGEQNTVNNRRDVFVEVVSEKKKVLLAANAPHPDVLAIREALSGLEEYEVVVRTGDNLPASFEDYRVVILHSLPSQTNLVRQLVAARKPVWFIMGAGSNNASFGQMQRMARLNVNPFNLQQIFAAYNSSFTTFTLPSNINAVMDRMPPLAVPGGSIEPGPGALVLFTAKGTSTPLWMLEQSNSPSALLVGEGLWRWRMYEYRFFNSHNVIDEAIRQTVAFLSVSATDRPFQIELPKYVWSDREVVSLNAYLLNANNEQINTPEVRLTINDSSGRKEDYNLERSGNAYKLNLGLRAAGTYTYQASTVFNGNKYTASGSFVVRSMPLEMMETGADYPLLHAIAAGNGGAVVPAAQLRSLYDSIRNNKDIRPVIQTRIETIPLVDWRWYFFLILLVAVAEWLLRKYWMAQ